jgi:hypothetical protein
MSAPAMITGQPTDRESLKARVLQTRPPIGADDPLSALWPADAMDRPVAEPVEIFAWTEADYAHSAWELKEFIRADIFGLDDRTSEGRQEALERFLWETQRADVHEWESLCAEEYTSEEEFQAWLREPFDWSEHYCRELFHATSYGVMYWLFEVLAERGIPTDGFGIGYVERSRIGDGWEETELQGDEFVFNELLARAGLNARLAPRGEPPD